MLFILVVENLFSMISTLLLRMFSANLMASPREYFMWTRENLCFAVVGWAVSWGLLFIKKCSFVSSSQFVLKSVLPAFSVTITALFWWLCAGVYLFSPFPFCGRENHTPIPLPNILRAATRCCSVLVLPSGAAPATPLCRRDTYRVTGLALRQPSLDSVS